MGEVIDMQSRRRVATQPDETRMHVVVGTAEGQNLVYLSMCELDAGSADEGTGVVVGMSVACALDLAEKLTETARKLGSA